MGKSCNPLVWLEIKVNNRREELCYHTSIFTCLTLLSCSEQAWEECRGGGGQFLGLSTAACSIKKKKYILLLLVKRIEHFVIKFFLFLFIHLYNETIKPVLPGLIRRFFDWIFSDSVLVKTVMNFLCAWMKKTEWMCFLFSCWKIFQILWKLKIYPSCVFFSLCVWALNI